MIVKKQTSNDLFNTIVYYINEFDKKNRKKIITKKLEELLYNFISKVEYDTIYIECTEDEVELVLLNYINMLSASKHIISLVFVDRRNSIDIIKELEQIKNCSETYRVLPTNRIDNKIKVYLAFYNTEFSEKYDVDLATKLFF